MREIFYTAQYYHLLHSVALLAIPLVKRPRLVRQNYNMMQYCNIYFKNIIIDWFIVG